jgi:hypothetical protein
VTAMLPAALCAPKANRSISDGAVGVADRSGGTCGIELRSGLAAEFDGRCVRFSVHINAPTQRQIGPETRQPTLAAKTVDLERLAALPWRRCL